MSIDELVQVAEILQELPRLTERGRNQLDQRFRVVRGDVLVRERRAERARVRTLLDAPVGGNAQRFLLHAFQAALQDARLP